MHHPILDDTFWFCWCNRMETRPWFLRYRRIMSAWSRYSHPTRPRLIAPTMWESTQSRVLIGFAHQSATGLLRLLFRVCYVSWPPQNCWMCLLSYWPDTHCFHCQPHNSVEFLIDALICTLFILSGFYYLARRPHYFQKNKVSDTIAVYPPVLCFELFCLIVKNWSVWFSTSKCWIETGG